MEQSHFSLTIPQLLERCQLVSPMAPEHACLSQVQLTGVPHGALLADLSHKGISQELPTCSLTVMHHRDVLQMFPGVPHRSVFMTLLSSPQSEPQGTTSRCLRM